MSMSTAEILEKAAEYIEENGWTQGSVGEDGEPRCTLGAMCSATGVSDWMDVLHTPAYDALGLHVGRIGHIGNWNDDPSRTKEEVCRMLRTVAAKLASAEPNPVPLLGGDLDGRYGPSDRSGSTETSLLDSDVISALVEHTEAYSAPVVDQDPGDENWEERRYTPVEA